MKEETLDPEIIDGEIIIAEFMQSALYKHWKMHPDTTFPHWHSNYVGSWDNLMPVVQKILNLHWSDFEHNIQTELQNKQDQIKQAVGNAKIKKACKSVSQFIRWYNEQKRLTLP